MNYRSVVDLNRDIRLWAQNLPRDLEVVVGVPRSGILAASLFALHRNLPLTDVEGLLEGSLFQSGSRMTARDVSLSTPRNIIVLDDSVNSGTQIKSIQSILQKIDIRHSISYAAVYVSPTSFQMVDYWFKILPTPRIFEWNILHHDILIDSCVDIDGFLCRDPTLKENDDGINYKKFIKNVEPLYLPTKKIGYIVTSRLEKYRTETENWLSKQQIEYDRLFMLDLPDMESRQELGIHASFKADIYRNTKASLFFESDYKQSLEIFDRTKKPVFCSENWDMINSNSLIPQITRDKKRLEIFFQLIQTNPLKALSKAFDHMYKRTKNIIFLGIGKFINNKKGR